MYCAQARSLAVNGIDGLAAPGKWVDFGLRSLAVGLHLADEDEEAPELEVVDFPYGRWPWVLPYYGGCAGRCAPGIQRGYCAQCRTVVLACCCSQCHPSQPLPPPSTQPT